ncbi:hypothetical protein ACI6Q5_21000 [Xanthomonas codiaei]|uniref:Integrase n=1 Tax=Xanthomonas codiaei TaxID=56463 RepID=A0ABW9MT31_9XANT
MSAGTQNQALAMLLFFYREVLHIDRHHVPTKTLVSRS